VELEEWSIVVDRRSFLITRRPPSVVGALDHHPLVEAGAGTDQRDQVRAIDRPPAVWAASSSLKAIAVSGGLAARALGHSSS
jgi:hypothetical protein